MAAGADHLPNFARHAVGSLETARELDLVLSGLAAEGLDRLSISLTLALERLLQGGVIGVGPGGPVSSGETTAAFLRRIYDADWRELGVPARRGAMLSMTGPLTEPLLRLRESPEASIDVLLRAWLPSRFAGDLAEQLDRGRMILWVPVRDPHEEKLVCETILGNSRQDVRVHDLPLRRRAR
ncbi:MAG: hypothetical protein MI920_02625 [Kiloniellales bacterium]|nr:hypothetical protein [Kiloniellales bacterium]